jgi:hypothetical protein
LEGDAGFAQGFEPLGFVEDVLDLSGIELG